MADARAITRTSGAPKCSCTTSATAPRRRGCPAGSAATMRGTMPGSDRSDAIRSTIAPMRGHAAATSPTTTTTCGARPVMTGPSPVPMKCACRSMAAMASCVAAVHQGQEVRVPDREAVGRRRLRRRLLRLPVVPQGRRIRRVLLPAAPPPASAGMPVVHEGDVAELAGHRVVAVHQLPVHEHADADTFGDGDGDQVLDVLRVMPEPELRESARARRILDRDGEPDRALDRSP